MKRLLTRLHWARGHKRERMTTFGDRTAWQDEVSFDPTELRQLRKWLGAREGELVEMGLLKEEDHGL